MPYHFICLQCNKSFYDTHSNRKYCSKRCQGIAKWRELLPRKVRLDASTKGTKTRLKKYYDKYLNQLPLSREKKEIIIWLIGLLSTDGFATSSKKYYSFRCGICSIEKDWLNQIAKILAKANINTNLNTGRRTKNNNISYMLLIREPFYVYCLIRSFSRFMIPRKFDNFKEKYEHYYQYFSEQKRLIKS